MLNVECEMLLGTRGNLALIDFNDDGNCDRDNVIKTSVVKRGAMLMIKLVNDNTLSI